MTETPEPGSLLAEIDAAQQRLKKMSKVDIKTELTGNVYPLLRMIAEQSGTLIGIHEHRIQQAEIAIAELATIGESVVLPDLAAQIDDVFSIGLQLCARIELKQGDLAKDQADELALKLVERYRNAVAAAREEISSVTVDDGDEDEEGEDAEG